MKNIWNYIKKAFSALNTWLVGLSAHTLYQVIIGMLLSAFCALVLNMGGWSFFPVIFVAVLLAAISENHYSTTTLTDFIATMLGAFSIAIIAAL